MSITPLSTDLDHVQALNDRPNANSGMTADQVKETFDQAGNDIKDYLNNSMIADINSTFVSNTSLATDRKLSAIGDFTGTINGLPIIMSNPGLATEFAALSANVVNKKVYIDVMNPPSDTGLLPLTGSNAAQDTTRLQAIFDWINSNQYSYNVGSLYTGYTYEVYFPTIVFNFTAKIVIKGSYIKLVGNQAVIKTNFNDYVFEATTGNGWQFEMSGFKFPANYKVLNLSTSNLEAGYTDIHHCSFIDTTLEALNINKQSSHCYIHDNTFHKCGYTLLIDNTDEAFFYNNWISEYPRSVSQDATIIHSSPLHVYTNLFVPYASTGGATEVAFINSYASLYMVDNHCGGEPGNHAIVNCFVTADSTAPVNANQIVAKNNLTLSSAGDLTAFRFFHIPNYIHLEGNRGFTDINKLMSWGAATVPATEIAASGGISNLRVVVKDNIGSSAFANNILTELVDATARYEKTKFVNRKSTLPSVATASYMTDLGSGNMSFNFDLGISASTVVMDQYMLEFTTQGDVVAGSTFYRGHYKAIITITGEFNSSLKFRVSIDPLCNHVGTSTGNTTYTVTATFGTSGVATCAASGTVDRTITIALNHAYGLPTQYGNQYRVWKSTEGLWAI